MWEWKQCILMKNTNSTPASLLISQICYERGCVWNANLLKNTHKQLRNKQSKCTNESQIILAHDLRGKAI